MKKHYLLYIVFASIFLTGCDSLFESNSDLKVWVEKQEKNLRGKVDPLPRNIDYTSVAFEGIPTIDPFKPGNTKSIVEIVEQQKAISMPSDNRRKEPLEFYPLADLELVGFLEQSAKKYAIIKSRDGKVFYVSMGNYVGNNFGKIIEMGSNKIVLKEMLLTNDVWSENIIELNMKD